MKRKWPSVQRILQEEGIEYDWVYTSHNNHAISLTREIIKQGYRKIAVAGGDGTINEVVNGIFLQKELNASEIIFGVLPLGTANDWSRTHNIPTDIRKCVRILKNGEVKQQDVGLAHFRKNGTPVSRYFNNVAGLSYDAFVVKYIEEHSKGKLNKFKYIYYVLYCLFKFSLPRAMIRFDDHVIDQPVYTINVGICKYSGGGMQIVPHADPYDGKFALTVAEKLSKLKVILNTWRFFTGTIGRLKQVHFFKTGEITVAKNGDKEIMLELDGEFMGYTPVVFKILPRALWIKV